MKDAAILAPLSSTYSNGVLSIRERFDRDRDGSAVLRRRSDLVDSLACELFARATSSGPGGPAGLCLAAVGGYGRRELFPCSDIDLVWVCADAPREAACRAAAAAALRALWDLGLRASGGLRTLAECRTFSATNPEFAISLLDARFLAGDASLFEELRARVIPRLIARERESLLTNLDSLTRQRHHKYGDTIFHLEPNVKESPGGLRDFHVARWLAGIARLDEGAAAKGGERAAPPEFGQGVASAFEFLAAARSLLHFRRERDDNHLTCEMQDEAAHCGVGAPGGGPLPVAEWMRSYFRHARQVDSLLARLRDETVRARRSLYAAFEDWRSRLSNADFSVVGGRVFMRQPDEAAGNPEMLLRMFEMVARHNLELSAEAERAVARALPGVAGRLPNLPESALSLQEILVLPYAAQALRAMHRLGLLAAVIPEFQAIDALVTRDFYHRYTVDEHTFNTLQALHELPKPNRRSGSALEAGETRLREAAPRFGALLSEIERPELLYLALLLHDLGKGSGDPEHVQGSVRAAERVLARMGTSPEEDRTVLFLVASHLDMSSTLLRRDILDSATIREFARKVGATERLKMLTLMTYADVKAVNPEALTPWKADALWQLYVSTSNRLTRSLDEDRLPAGDDELPGLGDSLPAGPPAEKPSDLHVFLAGFPERYLAVHAPGEILEHLAMARSLSRAPAQIRLERGSSWWQLTLMTHDRPLLFATVTGVLASWGMSIVKAEAFSNAEGLVLDVFGFDDVHRTLELNPPEISRFEQSLLNALGGNVSMEALVNEVTARRKSGRAAPAAATQMRFDDTSSSRSTLLELVTADKPGLLFDVSRALAAVGCNIEVALIDTEGRKAIDVFYLTLNGAKLDGSQKAMVQRRLSDALAPAAEA